ncbi:hypothetical protein WMY93_013827 [Mugilogobius chulae]|uniref:Uncharacterized protein n=1 Tax=Mugilogobius chulae TaxID=88201 RepID=A0AAW0P7E6_9GOBI
MHVFGGGRKPEYPEKTHIDTVLAEGQHSEAQRDPHGFNTLETEEIGDATIWIVVWTETISAQEHRGKLTESSGQRLEEVHLFITRRETSAGVQPCLLHWQRDPDEWVRSKGGKRRKEEDRERERKRERGRERERKIGAASCSSLSPGWLFYFTGSQAEFLGLHSALMTGLGVADAGPTGDLQVQARSSSCAAVTGLQRPSH